MTPIDIDLHPVDHISIDALGQPGKRVFYIQGWQGERTVTLIIEKLQLQTLAVGIEQFLAEVQEKVSTLREASAEYDEEQMRILIKQTISQRVNENELDFTDLTLRDLDTIADSFTTTLRGIYHPRIQYPALEGGFGDGLEGGFKGAHESGQGAALLPISLPVKKNDEATTPTAVNQQSIQLNERQIH
jgi:hypothetical protein